MNSRLVNVILTENGLKQTYFTLEGIEIGGFDSGVKQKPVEVPKPSKGKGGVVAGASPEEVRKQKESETELQVSKLLDKKT